MLEVYKLDIAESEEDLKQLLRIQKTALDQECIQLLYLLKTHQAKTVQEAASLLERHRVTVSEPFSDSLLILQLSQAGCRRAKRLQIPEHIILMFQPSRAPETNPSERVWQHLKQGLR